MKKRLLSILLLISISLVVIYIATDGHMKIDLGDANINNANITTKNDIKVVKLESVEPIIQNPSENVYAEILPRVELLAGVLSQTTWIDYRGPNSGGNEYYRKLKEFFSKYKEHEAVRIAQTLTNMGFTYDAPLGFILTVGELPKLNLDNEYSDYLIGRSQGKEILEKFRFALVDLAEESNFMQFFEDNRNLLTKCMESTMLGVNLKEIVDWNTKFYGKTGEEYHLVFAPAMFPGGGYGATINKTNGGEIIYQVIRESGNGITSPTFADRTSIGTLSLHEWGHSHVNPAVEKYFDKFTEYELDEFFVPVADKMSAMAYPEAIYFFNEQILRACTIIAYEDLYDITVAQKHLTIYDNAGFYLTNFTIETFEEYTSNRDRYPTIEDFIPYLFEQYYKSKDSLLELTKKYKK